MSTELRNVTPTLSQTRFFGGKDRGVSVQVTQTGLERTPSTPMGIGMVQLTREEAGMLAAELVRFATGTEFETPE